MDSHDGWRLQPVAEPVSYFDAATLGAMDQRLFGAPGPGIWRSGWLPVGRLPQRVLYEKTCQ